MLKIKDNVDLKELEKYGFKYYENCYEKWLLRLQDTPSACVDIRITNNRVVYPYADLDYYNLSNKAQFKMHDIMFDMITAGIVEKVEE